MQELTWLFDPLFLSIKVVLCQGLLLAIFGLALAYFLAFSRSKFKVVAEVIVTFPLIFPPIATGVFTALSAWQKWHHRQGFKFRDRL